MTDFLRTWGPIFVLAAVPGLLNVVAHALHGVAIGVLDRWIADDLPMTAGEWLAHQIRELGLDGKLRVVTSEAKSDAYAPWERTIHLSELTCFKRDPLFWAIAAHELGHARFGIEHPIAARVVRSRWPRRFLTAVGFAVLFGNVLFAGHAADRIAFGCLAGALALAVLPIVEEAIASTYAWQRLRGSTALRPGHKGSALAILFVAFTTYLSVFAGYVYLMTRWDEVERVTGGGRAPSGGPTALGVIALIACTLFGAVHVVWLVRALARGRVPALTGGILLLATPVIVWLAWDGGSSPAYRACVLLAFVPFARILAALFMLPATIVCIPLRALAARIGGGIDRTEALMTARAAGRIDVLAGNRWWKSLRAPTTAIDRIASLAPMLALPLLVAYWL